MGKTRRRPSAGTGPGSRDAKRGERAQRHHDGPAPGETRGVAARVLQDIEQRSAFSNRVLSDHLERHPQWTARDRGLITTLVYGVLRHRTRLDAHIDAHAHRPTGLRGETRQLLRIGAFELRALGHPPHAVLTEIGHAAARLPGGAGLRRAMHGILARIDTEGAALDEALASGRTLDVLDRRWSIPRWLAGRWRKQLGDDAALARAQALAAPPPIDLRVDTHRIDRDALSQRLQADHPRARIEPLPERDDLDTSAALRVHGAGDLFHGPLHDEGLVSVQGLAAQQPARWLAPRPGERILDACAGLGVKTLQLAELMERRGTVIAADADPRHAADHDDLARRGRLRPDAFDHRYVVADLGAPEPVPGLDDAPFDAVLLDVPCTGLGNLARHPEIRWLRSHDDLAARATLQRALLYRHLDRVRPGGRLVYAVCSPEPEEGPAVVEAVLAQAHQRSPDSGWSLVRARCFTPEDDGTEGFYVARLDRAP